MSEDPKNRKGGRPTVVDVARHANVSQGTVSRYLNGLPIRKDNQERVLQAIEELRYTRSAAAHAMRSERSNMVGLLVPDYDEFHARLLGLLSRLLREEGISTHAMCHAYSIGEDSMVDALGSFQAHRVDAIAVNGTLGKTEQLLELAAAGTRIVTYDNAPQVPSFFSVTVNNREAACEAVSELIANGHERCAIATGDLMKWTAQERLQGWRDAFEIAGKPVPEDLVQEADWTRDGGRRAFDQLWKRADRPTAFFASNHQIALGIVSTCRERGVDIPKDISLVSFDDIETFQFLTPPITAIAQPVEAIAKAIKRLLMAPEPKVGAKAPHENLKCEFRIRESIAAPSISNAPPMAGET